MHWYPLRVKSRCEKKTFAALHEMNIEVYLPLLKTKRRWSDRWKKVDMPLFPGYIFVRINLKQRFHITEVQHVSGFITFQNELAWIPDDQIDAIRRFIEHPELVRVGTGKLAEGQRVKVISGPFADMKGHITRIKNLSRLNIAIEVFNKILSVEIDERDVVILPSAEQK